MGKFPIFNFIATFIIIGACYFFAKQVIKKSKSHEEKLMAHGIKAIATILSIRQSGLFINNNPVLDLKLRITTLEDNHSYLIENYKETALLIALDSYKVGKTYNIRIGINETDIQFERDSTGRPVSTEED